MPDGVSETWPESSQSYWLEENKQIKTVTSEKEMARSGESYDCS